MKDYTSRQAILKSQSDIIHGYYDFIHTPPATLNKLLKKIHERRVLSVRNCMKSLGKHKTKKNIKHARAHIRDDST
jgi:hypothetical protein